MEKDRISQRKNTQAHLIIGVVLVLLGMGIIADLLNIFNWNIRHIVFSWQMLLIALGVVFIASRDNKPTGYILLVIGGFFILPRIFSTLPHYWPTLFWPVMLILLGLIIIFHRGGRTRRRTFSASDDYLDDVAIFGGGDKFITSKEFKGGKITHIFGGSKYDFTNSALAKGTHVLELTMIFGGTKLIVPEDWDVRVEMSSVFGGFSDKRARSIIVKDPDKSLIIKGVNLFGGGEIVNF